MIFSSIHFSLLQLFWGIGLYQRIVFEILSELLTFCTRQPSFSRMKQNSIWYAQMTTMQDFCYSFESIAGCGENGRKLQPIETRQETSHHCRSCGTSTVKENLPTPHAKKNLTVNTNCWIPLTRHLLAEQNAPQTFYQMYFKVGSFQIANAHTYSCATKSMWTTANVC